MAFIDFRVIKGKKYWSIVESRRVDGKPRNFIVEYLGTAESLLERLRNINNYTLKSYSHGDTHALLTIALELDIISIINKYIPDSNSKKPIRDGFTVGASLLLAAVGRACHPTSKLGWYEWCKKTSLEYCLKKSFKKLDSRHFWDQMDFLPVKHIPGIEEEIVGNVIKKYGIKLDTLFYDTTNYFTFIDSKNEDCKLARRGKNKQKRYDLRQIGMALLVTRENQFPLFHKVYEGNKNDFSSFKENFHALKKRLKKVSKELEDITIVFDKGNNSKDNFKKIDKTKSLFYVAGLVPSHFKDLIKEANQNLSTLKIDEETIPVYRIKKIIWGEERTCVVTISKQLKDGQIQGIYQHLENKFKKLEELKQQLENPNKKKNYEINDIDERLSKIIRGQFIEEILKYEIIEINNAHHSFTYYIDEEAFQTLKKDILGRKIHVTNRHDWSNEEIIKAYHGQSKVEYAFRNLKNPYHLSIRPQYHWTDQKIEVHFFICIIAYLLTMIIYSEVRKKTGYSKNVNNFMDDLNSIRLGCQIERKNKNSKGRSKINFMLENMNPGIKKIADALNITNQNLRPKCNLSCYK